VGHATVHHQVFRSFGSCLLDEVGSETAMCPATLKPTFLVRRAPVRDVSCGSGSCLSVGRAPGSRASGAPLWAVGFKHEEKPSRPACAARLAYS
jgi:hypothetical protein